MKKFILVWALLLSACANHQPAKVVITPAPESRKSVIESQPVVIPTPAPIEVQAPIRSNHPPKKNEHNVEED